MTDTLDILWEKYGEDPFWLYEAELVVAKCLNLSRAKAQRAILNTMPGGAIEVVGSSRTVTTCTCNGDEPHTHYSGNLQFKFYWPIWGKPKR